MSGLGRFAALAIGLVATASLVAGACSSSGGTSGTSTTTQGTSATSSAGSAAPATTDHPELEQAVRAYGVALFAGDAATVHAMQSARCKEVNGLDLLTQAVTSLAQEYGAQPMTAYAHQVDGEVAAVTYDFRSPYLGQADERWIVEEGTWRNDDCPTPRPDDGTEPFAPR